MYETLAKKLLEARQLKTVAERNAFLAKEVIGERFERFVETRQIAIDEKEKTVVFVMSDNSIDRHGDIVDQDTWNFKHFDKNAPFFWQHRASDFPLGKWVDHWFEADPDNEGKKRLLGKAVFRTEYDDVARAFDHVVKGDLNMVSVGFIPHRVEYDEERDAFILYDCELLECSLVGIGSNRNALTADKNVEPDTIKSDKDAREKVMEVRNHLDRVIHSQADGEVVSKARARDILNKAIRVMRSE